MGITGEVLLTMLCVLGLGLSGWWLMGRLLRPVPGSAVCAVIPCRGDGEGMEQGVRTMVWLRSLGLLNCPVVLMDAGLSPMGRETALRLALRWPDVILWPADDLKEYLLHQ